MSKPDLTLEQQVAERLGWLIDSGGHWYRVPEPGYLQTLPDDVRFALLYAEKRLLAVTQERAGALDDAAFWRVYTRDQIEQTRQLREAAGKALIPLAALVVSGECVAAPTALSEDVKLAIIEAHDALCAALGQKKTDEQT